jgi:hypothetical protein
MDLWIVLRDRDISEMFRCFYILSKRLAPRHLPCYQSLDREVRRGPFSKSARRGAPPQHPRPNPAARLMPGLEVQAKRELAETALIVIAAQGNRVETTLQPNDR